MSPFVRVGVAPAAAVVLAVALAACVPESDDGAAVPAPVVPPSSTPTASPSAVTSSVVPSSSPSSSPGVSLPASCEDVYSAGMRATLDQTVPTLNDPGVTLLSTDQAPLLELLETVPTLRCTWGTPSERGLSTNVSIVGAAQASTVLDTLRDAGYGCEDDGTSTLCRIEQRGVSLDDVPYERGETQALAGSVWVTTSWINVDPQGYTQDILATVGG